MPLYEYHCNNCRTDFEVRRSFSDTGTPDCPVCGESAFVIRKFSAPAIVFKGSGFYVNDSRGKNAAGAPAKNHGAADGNEKSNGKAETVSSESATPAKTAAKTEKTKAGAA